MAKKKIDKKPMELAAIRAEKDSPCSTPGTSTWKFSYNGSSTVVTGDNWFLSRKEASVLLGAPPMDMKSEKVS